MPPHTAFLTELLSALTRLSGEQGGVLLAVSGGLDSMAMLHGVLELKSSTPHFRVEACHMNHSLRGTESDADEKLVRNVCNSRNIPVTIGTLPKGSLKADSKGSLEEAARIARYEFLLRTAQSRGLPLVATAHHQKDQVETLLFNILRGTGLRGLRGIPESRRLAPDVTLIRPLLQISRNTIDSYMNSQALLFRDDSSNQAAEYSRNRIRRLLDLLSTESAEKASGLMESLLQLAAQAAATTQAIDSSSERILADCVRQLSPAAAEFDRNRLTAWPEPLVRHSLTLLWIQLGWPRQQMNSTHWQRVSTAIFSGSPNRWNLPGKIELTVRRRTVKFLR